MTYILVMWLVTGSDWVGPSQGVAISSVQGFTDQDACVKAGDMIRRTEKHFGYACVASSSQEAGSSKGGAQSAK